VKLKPFGKIFGQTALTRRDRGGAGESY